MIAGPLFLEILDKILPDAITSHREKTKRLQDYYGFQGNSLQLNFKSSFPFMGGSLSPLLIFCFT